MSRAAVLAAALAAAVLAAAAPISATAAPAAGTPALPLQTCRLPGLEHDALCGTLTRPLIPAHPDGRTIALQVAVIPALARNKLADPVFFFAGGPGQSAIAGAGAIDRLLGRLVTRRDIVLIDQRGTGRSAPLGCDTPAPEEALQVAFDDAQMLAAMARCRTQLEALPWGDLRQYTTTVAMVDADAVRAAIGAEKINLVGGSYGTRAALEYLRLYPQHVRRVVIDGVAPPDMVLPATFGADARAALDALFRDCGAEAACAARHPRLAADWSALLDSLPRPVTFTDPVNGAQRTVTLTRSAAFSLVRPALYVPALAAVLPHAISEAAQGRYGPLMAAGAVGNNPLGLSEGEHFSVICAEDVPRLPPASANVEPIEAMYRNVCAQWPRGAVDPGFYTVPRSPAPVLLLSGALDPVTPPRHAARMAAALGPLARHVVVGNTGHGAINVPCVRDAVFRYLDAAADSEAAQVEVDCAPHLPRPPAFTPPAPARAAAAPRELRSYAEPASASAASPRAQEPRP